MQPQQHQLMGYDRAITMFSPDGRLLQVEYAKKTVKQGSTAIGVLCKDGVALVTDKRIHDNLVFSETVEKIFEVDEHIIATASGIMPDARVLVENAQTKAQQHRITFDSPADVLSLVKDIASIMQSTTQGGGYRPFGVTMIIAGSDKQGLRLASVDPVGVYNQYKATAIGEKGEEAQELLRKEWKHGMTINEGIKLAVSVMKRILPDNVKAKRIDCAYVNDKAEIHRLTRKEVEEVLK